VKGVELTEGAQKALPGAHRRRERRPCGGDGGSARLGNRGPTHALLDVEHARCQHGPDDDDSLVLVAGMNRSQVRKLEAGGVRTLATLAQTNTDLAATGIGPSTVTRLRKQAQLQLQERETGQPAYELLPPERPELGLALLPIPTDADLIFDMESDPWAQDEGLEYLFGLMDSAGKFTPIWARDRAAEKKAFEDLVDIVIARLDANPDMHVYHYASYEPTALKRLMVWGSKITSAITAVAERLSA
jgi:predicted RecB family nuclease